MGLSQGRASRSETIGPVLLADLILNTPVCRGIGVKVATFREPADRSLPRIQRARENFAIGGCGCSFVLNYRVIDCYGGWRLAVYPESRAQ